MKGSCYTKLENSKNCISATTMNNANSSNEIECLSHIMTT